MPYINVHGSKVWVPEGGKINLRDLNKTSRPGVPGGANYRPDKDLSSSQGPVSRPQEDGYSYEGYQGNVAGQLGGRQEYNITPGQAEAYRRQVEQGELSQWQLDQILGSNSPLMRRAAATGHAVAGQRGLMNSSLAAGAAQGAMVDRAQPFALSDADAYRRAATENLAARNTASLTNAQLLTQANISGGELTGAYDRALMNAKAQAMNAEVQRRWQTGESAEQRRWQTGENVAQRDWQTGERIGGQDWQTGERVGSQDFQSGENQLNRDWTSEENMHQRMYDWATTQMQTYASIGMNREQAMMQVLSNVYSNPNLTAEEQRAAAANAQAVYQDLFNQPWNPPEAIGGIDPTTGQVPGAAAGSATPGAVGDPFNPDTFPWGDYGAAGEPMRQNYIDFMNSPQGRLTPMTPDQWMASFGYGGGTAFPSVVNPNAESVMGDLPDI